MAAKSSFKIGDIVKLKSGGPDMTVKSENTRFDTGAVYGYECQWFAGKKLESGNFPTDSLEKVTPDSTS